MISTLKQVAAAMVAPGKGILASDESITTMDGRLERNGIAPIEENRRAYRELLSAAPGLSDGISGVILCEETLRQRYDDGRPFPQALREAGLLTGVKVDTGAKPLPGFPGETVTEGLDGLPARLEEFAAMGASFAKWRAVFRIDEGLPSSAAVHAGAHALGRYAAACQAAGIVPIVEPEVVMDGDHPLQRCAQVTRSVLIEVATELRAFDVDPAGIVLKPNMVVEGNDYPSRATPDEVAAATVEVLEVLPGQLAGVAFLSGGQPPERATANLAATARHPMRWPLTFSFGRALVDPALTAWGGLAEQVADGQRALLERVACNSAAVRSAGRELESTDA